MNDLDAISKMVAPGERRNKRNGGVLQIHITRACNENCLNCTQGSNLRGPYQHMTPEQFDIACQSLKGYPFTIGVFGGNPAVSPHFEGICEVLRSHFPREQCGLWCNNPLGKGRVMAKTFNPARSNLNCHLDMKAYKEFKRDWPGSLPFGHRQDSRHSPVFVAMKDVIKKLCAHCLGIGKLYVDEDVNDEMYDCPECSGDGEVYDESQAWDLIADCDINKHWSASIGLFRGELRGWFCEIAMAQSILHQNNPDYPDTGFDVSKTYFYQDEHGCDIGPRRWWELPIKSYGFQIRKHCHDCGVPLRGYGALACDENGIEQVSETHADIYQTKKPRNVQLVQLREELDSKNLKFIDYLGGGKK